MAVDDRDRDAGGIDAGLLRRVREAWPGIDVADDALLAFVTARSSTRLSDRHEPAVRQAALADLYITCACSAGDTAAIRALEDRYAALFDSVRRRFGPRAPPFDELLADVRARLFVSGAGEAPRITKYSGEVDLGAWLKVVVTRVVLNRLAARKPEEGYDERILEGLLLTQETPERSLLRAEGQATFRAAFRRAVGELRARDRQFLRLAFAEGFTIDDLSALYGVHRTTTFRWVQAASEKLAGAMRRIVREELKLSPEEYERWLKELRSSLEVSVERYLAASQGD